ncbi:MAG: helix-turn-helix domain-containing protein [Blautia sp.]
MKAACEALRSTTRSVSEIAYDNGFRNLSNFNRQFRNKVGCTPQMYRKEFQNP